MTNDVPPRIHDLVRLAEIAEVHLSSERRDTLGRLRQYCLEGRYPQSWPPPPTLQEAESEVGEAREVLEWLGSLLK